MPLAMLSSRVYVRGPRSGTFTSMASVSFCMQGDDVDRDEVRRYGRYRAEKSEEICTIDRPNRSIGQRCIRDERVSEGKRE
jgi:hypothetical protein